MLTSYEAWSHPDRSIRIHMHLGRQSVCFRENTRPNVYLFYAVEILRDRQTFICFFQGIKLKSKTKNI